MIFFFVRDRCGEVRGGGRYLKCILPPLYARHLSSRCLQKVFGNNRCSVCLGRADSVPRRARKRKGPDGPDAAVRCRSGRWRYVPLNPSAIFVSAYRICTAPTTSQSTAKLCRLGSYAHLPISPNLEPKVDRTS